ncbi:Zn(2)-C6 fungal-type domain-containing protein [Trichoderma simmonsii]|uniref:Zn(2)-C6 fungal-type domain-containing protein n=1 Tax=Trichoderma simmonsii TaxID=1491479 RepID=A0A8G0L6X9_9HYPO|nr:Zn(2)-C6 fungal-type domain-containing protein [Trichoderma simmonsii]
MSFSPNEDLVSYARTACEPCKRSKRRCDRVLPSCELCNKKDVQCVYVRRRRAQDVIQKSHHSGRHQSPSTATSRRSMIISRESSESNGNSETPSCTLSSTYVSRAHGGSDAAAAIYFIAPDIFHQARLDLPRPQLSLIHRPHDASDIHKISSTYFETVHWWMPIVSRKGFFAKLLNPLQHSRAELCLLVTAMKLICSQAHMPTPGDDANNIVAYKRAKQMYFEMETSGNLSLRVLQAGILVALYETGHAIYPAAYLSVGACVRYGIALGIDKLLLESDGAHDGLQMYTQTEVEEQRRVWWALLLLDRFMCLASPERTPSTKNPTFNDLLPIDDQNFDSGNIKPGDPFSISAGFNLEMGLFSRLAQATYLLSQAIELLAPSHPAGCADLERQITQLRRTIHSLVNISDTEARLRDIETHPGICPQLSICYSTILLLQERHWKMMENVIKAKTQPFEETLASLDRLFGSAVYLHANPTVFNLERMATPLFAHVVYHATRFLIKLCNGKPDKQMQEKIHLFKELLHKASQRWRVAAVYLSILEAEEVAVVSNSASDLLLA